MICDHNNSANHWVSSSRTYVAICEEEKGGGTKKNPYYTTIRLYKFMLPVPESFSEDCATKVKNNASFARWYFVNVLEPTAVTTIVIRAEDINLMNWHRTQLHIPDEVSG